jgi:hypothetical protein
MKIKELYPDLQKIAEMCNAMDGSCMECKLLDVCRDIFGNVDPRTHIIWGTLNKEEADPYKPK